MDTRSIDNLEEVDSSAESTDLVHKWREIVKSGTYRMTGGDKRDTMYPNSSGMRQN